VNQWLTLSGLTTVENGRNRDDSVRDFQDNEGIRGDILIFYFQGTNYKNNNNVE